MIPKAIEVEGVVKRYSDVTAVDGVSFSVERGEIFGILGPNGSGKTSLVEGLQGLRSIEGGSVSVLGLDPSVDPDKVRLRIGSQLQESSLPSRAKVWEILDLFTSLRSSSDSWEQLLHTWGLTDQRNTRVGRLSGGQRQRLFVALAWIGSPAIVFLDEMTTGLDPASRRVTWDLIRRLRDEGTTVVVVTHFMEEAETLCDRVIILNQGRLIAEGAPSMLVDRYGWGARVSFTLDGDVASWLDEVPHVDTWHNNAHQYQVEGSGPVLAHVAAALVGHGHAPVDLRQERATLEDVYLTLTSVDGSQL